ncbi:MAG: thiolase family protein [Pseudomonadota bacterium]
MAERFVIVGAKRTPFGKYLGSLSEMEPLDVAVHAGRAALTHQGPDLTESIDQIFVGNCIQASFETGSVAGRQISLALGLNKFTVTLDTACCSPLTALRTALWGLRLGEISSALIIGVESMSRVPHMSRQLRTGVRAGDVVLKDQIFPIGRPGHNPVAVDASDGAAKYGISRLMLDTWAMGSHAKWARAQDAKLFADELAPMTITRRGGRFLFAVDESPRPNGNLAAMQELPTVFGAGTTTAGNTPGPSDGAAAVVMMTEKRAVLLGLEILATIVDVTGETDMPDGISWIPALTIRKALDRNGLEPYQMDLVEINEAFAAMPLVGTKILADGDKYEWHKLLKRTNVNGGAIAVGHPVGASGLRILMTMMYELRRRGGGRGVAAICGGLGQGEAVIVKA